MTKNRAGDVSQTTITDIHSCLTATGRDLRVFPKKITLNIKWNSICWEI